MIKETSFSVGKDASFVELGNHFWILGGTTNCEKGNFQKLDLDDGNFSLHKSLFFRTPKSKKFIRAICHLEQTFQNLVYEEEKLDRWA